MVVKKVAGTKAVKPIAKVATSKKIVNSRTVKPVVKSSVSKKAVVRKNVSSKKKAVLNSVPSAKDKVPVSSVARKSAPSKKSSVTSVSSGGKFGIINKAPKKRKKFERVSSGIKNLDKIISGGFGKNSTNLIVGGSGNGKSIFSIQFLLEGVKRGESVLYITFEEKKDVFYANMLELGWDLEKYEKEGKFFFLSYTPQKVRTMLEEGGGEIESIVLTQKVSRIVMDSITAFVMLFNTEVEMREGTLSLFSMLRGWTCTSLLVYERDPLIDEREKSRVLEFETDSLVFLYFIRLKKDRERFLEVYKMRGTNHSTNIYSYEIKAGKGISVSATPYKGKLRK
ncbi:hypothetical protein KAS08_02110 [Candidatus Pacearchaeota archaeon]|nr:hypothetical protein [Candidatus Pacearchaeota archaeon]